MNDSSSKDYWESRLKENFGLHGTGFIGLGKHYNIWMYKIRGKVFLHKMKSMHVDFSNIDILDIGSGTGFYIDLWKELGAKRVVGTDITNIAVRNLKQKYPNNEFYQVDIGDDDVKNLDERKYDIVSAFDILFHIVDDKRYDKAFKNIYSLLNPKGIFVFSENFLHRNAIRSIHQVSRPLDIIEKILLQNGFEIVERCPMFVLMNAPIDTNLPIIKGLWKVIRLSLNYCGEIGGLVTGGILYPLELTLVSLMKESPTTEMMICRKN
jgi:SAM-dependent methyltransferase